MTATTAYLGLGANLGDRLAALRAAAAALPDVVASSSVYETEPVGEVLDQPAFYNACLRLETRLGPEALLAACQAVEVALGRERTVRHGPRTIDVDVLLMGDLVRAGPDPVIPHPGLLERRFVLVPLLELDPGVTVPGAGPAAYALEALPAEGWVRRVAGALR